MHAMYYLRRGLPALAALVAALSLAACSEDNPLAFDRELQPQLAAGDAELSQALATLRSATAAYHDLNAALADGFVLLHECESRDGAGVGAVYVNFARVVDGIADPASPDALVYEPNKNGKSKLVAAEFAIPYALWTGSQAPEFFGNAFQTEDEFGVFGLHVWVWRENPNGMFAESNPRVSCES
jgi:hypothetical protein